MGTKPSVWHMGNVNVPCRDHLCLERALRHIDKYGQVVRAKLNVGKSMHIVYEDVGDLNILEVKIMKEGEWMLETFFR